VPNYKPIRTWIKEHHLSAPNTLEFIRGLEHDIEDIEQDLEVLSKGLGVRVVIAVES
jgi:hypothetical protein